MEIQNCLKRLTNRSESFYSENAATTHYIRNDRFLGIIFVDNTAQFYLMKSIDNMRVVFIALIGDNDSEPGDTIRQNFGTHHSTIRLRANVSTCSSYSTGSTDKTKCSTR